MMSPCWAEAERSVGVSGSFRMQVSSEGFSPQGATLGNLHQSVSLLPLLDLLLSLCPLYLLHELIFPMTLRAKKHSHKHAERESVCECECVCV